MARIKTDNQKKKEFLQLGADTTLELISMGMNEIEIINFWKESVALVTLKRHTDKYDRRVSRLLWFSLGFLLAALLLYISLTDNFNFPQP